MRPRTTESLAAFGHRALGRNGGKADVIGRGAAEGRGYGAGVPGRMRSGPYTLDLGGNGRSPLSAVERRGAPRSRADRPRLPPRPARPRPRRCARQLFSPMSALRPGLSTFTFAPARLRFGQRPLWTAPRRAGRRPRVAREAAACRSRWRARPRPRPRGPARRHRPGGAPRRRAEPASRAWRRWRSCR